MHARIFLKTSSFSQAPQKCLILFRKAPSFAIATYNNPKCIWCIGHLYSYTYGLPIALL
jgi:hypothetical protein